MSLRRTLFPAPAWAALAGASVALGCFPACSAPDPGHAVTAAENVATTTEAITDSSGLGRFQTQPGLCLEPLNPAQPLGSGLVTGDCDGANARVFSLGMSTLPNRSGGQGTLQVGGLCLEWSVQAASVRLETCNQPCVPESRGDCANPDQSQEWTWANGNLQPANQPDKCVTVNGSGSNAAVTLSDCTIPPSPPQAFTPLDFNLTFASGIGAPFDYDGPHLPDVPPLVPPSASKNIQCLDVDLDLETWPGTMLDDFQCNATNAQWFHFDANHDLLTPAGTCVTAASAVAGGGVTVSPCTGAPGQQWSYSVSSLFGFSAGIFSGLCLDVRGESATPLTGTALSTCSFASTADGQRWVANLVWPKGRGLVYSDSNPQAGGWIEPSQAVAGDFNGDGFSDVAYIFKSDGVAPGATPGHIDIDVYPGNGHGFSAGQRWSTELGGWVDGMQFRAGDFDGDGLSDIAVAFADTNNDIDLDVHPSRGSQANGGFAGPQRWASGQGGVVDRSDWLAGDFDGDGKTDLAYVFSLDGTIDIDVHRSKGSLANGGFEQQRWNNSQGAWLDLSVSDPLGPDLLHPFRSEDSGFGECTSCSRQAQWMVGDFNGDHLADLGVAFNDGSGHTNLDVHLSTGSQASGGFVLQNAAKSQGGWIGASFWIAEDMNDDGRADIVDVYDANLANIDVHVSNISGLSVPSANGFVLSSYATLLGTDFYYPLAAYTLDEQSDSSALKGTILPGGFVHPLWSRLGDIAVVTERFVQTPVPGPGGGVMDVGYVGLGSAF